MSRAVLLIHGFLTGPDDWDGLVPLMQERYDEVAVFCQPGHIRQEDGCKPDYKPFTADAAYKALDTELERLFSEHDRVDIVGHSMGAAMAVWAAANRPVGRLCVLAPAFRFPRFGILVKNMFYRTKRKKFAKMKTPNKYAQVLSAENDRYFNEYKSGQKVLLTRLVPYWTPRNIAVLYRIVSKAQKTIKNITCATEVIWGNFDEFVPLSAIKGFEKRLETDDVTFVNYGNLGHSMMLSMSKDIVFKDILSFLDGLAVENVQPENPGVERVVRHITVVDTGSEKYKRVKTFLTGSRIVAGKIELVEEKSSTITPY